MAAIRTHRNAPRGTGSHIAHRDRVVARINVASAVVLAGATLATGALVVNVSGITHHAVAQSNQPSSSPSQSGGIAVPSNGDNGFTPAPVAPQPSQYQPPVASSGGS